jgi:hypothetical protein
MFTYVSRITIVLLLAVMVFATTLVSGVPTRAQAKKVACDSDVTLSLYIAERYFNLDAILTKLAASPAGKDLPVVDISELEKGQYEPLFAALRNIDRAASDQGLDDKAIDAMLQDLTSNKMMDANSNILKPALIPGEPPQCSILRAQLNFFYTTVASQGASPALVPTPVK